MTEPYATTIAAVAPVLLLVAVVEVQQITQRTRQDSAAMTAAYRDAAAKLRAREAGVSPGELQEIRARVQQLESEHNAGLQGFARVLYYVWAFTATALVAVVSLALTWLGRGSGDADPFMAWFCFSALLWGTFVVVNMPVVAWIAQSRQEIKSAEAYGRARDRALSEAQEP